MCAEREVFLEKGVEKPFVGDYWLVTCSFKKVIMWPDGSNLSRLKPLRIPSLRPRMRSQIRIHGATPNLPISSLGQHMKEKWHTCEGVMTRIWMSHGMHMNESWPTYEWVMARMWMSHTSYMIDVASITAWKIEWVLPQVWMSHGTHVRESWHTYVWVTQRVCLGHGPHMNESFHTQHLTGTESRHTQHLSRTNSLRQSWFGIGAILRESWRTYEWVESYTHMNESWPTYELLMAHTIFDGDWIIYICCSHGKHAI